MSEPSKHGRAGKKVLVVEDVRLAETELLDMDTNAHVSRTMRQQVLQVLTAPVNF